MQNKFEFPFNEIPKQIWEKEIGQYLNAPDIAHVSQTSKSNQTLFKPMLDESKIATFLNRSVRREDDTVQKMLKNDLTLLTKRGKVTDCSGRTFETISAFEYMLWALDKHGWTILLDCIPNNKNNEELFKELLAQYNKVKNYGVTYTLNGMKINEHHFDFTNTIIEELKYQFDTCNAANPNWKAIREQWNKGVGGAQKLLPMHVVYEYCSRKSFTPTPEFNSKPESSSQFFNVIRGKMENWFSVDSMLGSSVAIYKGLGLSWFAFGEYDGVRGQEDLAALKALCEIRTNDFIALKSTLENLLKSAAEAEHKDNNQGGIIF